MNSICLQCPRACGVDRERTVGFCGVPQGFRVARAAKHMWEEPSIGGKNGSGTVFFSGCNLRCIFCQNRVISHERMGHALTDTQLTDLFLRLQDAGVHNINLVTPTHYALQLAKLLPKVKSRLHIPIVYNCGGYEAVETLRQLDGLIDIYLPDIKYFSTSLSKRYSAAEDYFPVARRALTEMLRQQTEPRLDADGMMVGGVMVRHLVLPSHRADSVALLDALAKEFGNKAFWLSLMSQYTPQFAKDAPYPNLHRRVTTFEYQTVADHAASLGFDGYFQERASANAAYTPDFYEESFLPKADP